MTMQSLRVLKLDNPHTKMEDTLVITGFGKMFYYSDKYSLIFLQGLEKVSGCWKKGKFASSWKQREPSGFIIE